MRVCQVDDCIKLDIAIGLCGMHRKRLKMHGDVNKVLVRIGQNRSKDPLYSTYTGMLQRTRDPNTKCAKNYMLRGIRVCDRWQGLDGFVNFVSDMGDKPSKEYSVERIDNDKGYSPDNCKWATAVEQVHNRRMFSNNTSGYTGVHWSSPTSKWIAQKRIDGKKVCLGYFLTKEEAAKAYGAES